MKVSNSVKVLASLGTGVGAILALHQAQTTFNSTNTSATKTYNPSQNIETRATSLQGAISTLSKEEAQVQSQLAATKAQLAQKQQEVAQATQTALAAENQAQTLASRVAARNALALSTSAPASSNLSGTQIIAPVAQKTISATTSASSSTKSGDD